MTRLQRFCLGLYPARWRFRYGGELEELIAASKPGARGTWNLFTAAIRLQMTRQTLGKMVALWTVSGLLLGFAASFLAKPRYISEATVILNSDGPGDDPNAAFLAWKTNILSRTVLASLLNSDHLSLRRGDVMRMPILDRIEGLYKDLALETLPTKSARSVPFRITFVDSDQNAAQQVVREVIRELSQYARQRFMYQRQEADLPALVTAIERLQARIDRLEAGRGKLGGDEPLPWQTPRQATLEVLDPASFPESPIYPNRQAFAVTGAGLGLACGLMLFTMRRMRSTPRKQVQA